MYSANEEKLTTLFPPGLRACEGRGVNGRGKAKDCMVYAVRQREFRRARRRYFMGRRDRDRKKEFQQK